MRTGPRIFYLCDVCGQSFEARPPWTSYCGDCFRWTLVEYGKAMNAHGWRRVQEFLHA